MTDFVSPRDPARTYEHDPLCDDDGWNHPGPCIVDPPDPANRQYTPTGACLNCDGYLDGSGELACTCAAESITAAVDEYASRAGSDPAEAGPYDSGSLAEIYAPRVRELLNLQAAGFTHARWAFDPELGVNHWHGVR